MSSQVIAALLGALVAFAGTYLLQRGQWRRAELAQVRLRLGAVRALTIDLCAADLSARITEEHRVLTTGSRFPTQAWFTHGHLVLGVLKAESIDPLMQVFGRFDSLNATAQAGNVDLSDAPEVARSLPSLRGKIEIALDLLSRFEQELDAKREQLQHPWKSRANSLEASRRAGVRAPGPET